MLNRVRRRLVDDRGEGALSVLLGSVLFLLAAGGVAGFVVMGLGATALAQSNELRTSALQQQVQAWEKTAWSDIVEMPATREELEVDGRTYEVFRKVEFNPTINGYAMTIASPRSKAPGSQETNCAEALAAKVDGCISLSGYITATADEVAPETPEGIVISAEQVTGDGAATNLVANGGFEQGLTGFATTGTVVEVAQPQPRSTGAKAARIAGAGSISSAAVAVNPGNIYRFDVWVRNAGTTTGEVQLRALAAGADSALTVPATLDTVTSTATGWQLLSGQFSVPATVTSLQLVVATTGSCASTCAWTVDDAFFALAQRNVITNPDFEAEQVGWELGAGAAIVETTNRVQGGAWAARLTGASQIASTEQEIAAGQWASELWLSAAAPSAASGTVELVAVVGGVDTVLASATLAGLGSDWSRLTGSGTLPAGPAQLMVRTVGAPAGFVISVDDLSLRQTATPTGLPAGSGYLTLASIDPNVFAGNSQVRVSFEYFGEEVITSDLRVGIYCGAGASSFAINDTALATTLDANATTTWLWARVAMPDLDRIQDCATPQIRVYSPSMVVDSTDIGTISILRVLSGLAEGGTQ